MPDINITSPCTSTRVNTHKHKHTPTHTQENYQQKPQMEYETFQHKKKKRSFLSVHEVGCLFPKQMNGTNQAVLLLLSLKRPLNKSIE